jgi:hypothetical protein
VSIQAVSSAYMRAHRLNSRINNSKPRVRVMRGQVYATHVDWRT